MTVASAFSAWQQPVRPSPVFGSDQIQAAGITDTPLVVGSSGGFTVNPGDIDWNDLRNVTFDPGSGALLVVPAWYAVSAWAALTLTTTTADACDMKMDTYWSAPDFLYGVPDLSASVPVRSGIAVLQTSSDLRLSDQGAFWSFDVANMTAGDTVAVACVATFRYLAPLTDGYP